MPMGVPTVPAMVDPAKRFSIEGKSVIVTGGGSNIGRAIVLGFAREGAAITIGERSGEGAAGFDQREERPGRQIEPLEHSSLVQQHLAHEPMPAVRVERGLDDGLDLLGGEVLTDEIDVLVERHLAAFLFVCCMKQRDAPAQSPSSPEKGPTVSFEGGDTGSRAFGPCRRSSQPSVQPPAGAMAGVLHEKGGDARWACRAGAHIRRAPANTQVTGVDFPVPKTHFFE